MKNKVNLEDAIKDPLIKYRFKFCLFAGLKAHIAAYCNGFVLGEIYRDGEKMGEITVMDLIKNKLE